MPLNHEFPRMSCLLEAMSGGLDVNNQQMLVRDHWNTYLRRQDLARQVIVYSSWRAPEALGSIRLSQWGG